MSDRPGEILSPETYRALQDAAITVLKIAAAKLRQAQLDDALREHGWSERVCREVAEACARRVDMVASDYPFRPNNHNVSEIGRLMAEYITPFEMDELQAAAFDADDELAAFIAAQDRRILARNRRRERGDSHEH